MHKSKNKCTTSQPNVFCSFKHFLFYSFELASTAVSFAFFFFLSHPNIKVIFYSYRKPPGLLLKCIYSNVFYWFAENKCHPADVKCLCQKQLAYANIGVSIRNGTKPSQMNDSVSHHVDLWRVDYSRARDAKHKKGKGILQIQIIRDLSCFL